MPKQSPKKLKVGIILILISCTLIRIAVLTATFIVSLGMFPSFSNPENPQKDECKMTVSGTTEGGYEFEISGDCKEVLKTLKGLGG